MQIKVGTDILKLDRFLNSYKKGGQAFSERIFTSQELKQNSVEQLASIFCLKEALVKALELSPGMWSMISTNRKDNGKLECSFLNKDIAQKVISLDTSISHEGGLIIAVVVALLE